MQPQLGDELLRILQWPAIPVQIGETCPASKMSMGRIYAQ
jgi:hypothetical protein